MGNLRVYCRVRPRLPTEEDKGDSCVGVNGSTDVVLRDLSSERRDEKRFEFTQVYGPSSQQEEVFADTEPLMTSVLDGYNVCIFAYGQSGTGKTFTMDGTDEKPGLVPRAMGGIFSVIGERQANFTHECFLSMIEIYNENIRDLLCDTKEAATGKRYEIMRDSLVGMYVKVAVHPNPNPNPHPNPNLSPSPNPNPGPSQVRWRRAARCARQTWPWRCTSSRSCRRRCSEI